MASAPLNWLLKIGGDLLNTTAQTICAAINELKSAIDSVPSVSVVWTGTASSTTIRKQQVVIGNNAYDIDGTAYMEQSVTLNASNPTVVTFTNNAITVDSVIATDVCISNWGIVPENVSCTSGTCTVTLPVDLDESTVTVRIYLR